MFITERELQGLYHKAEFSEYLISKNDRLTPEAKSFLTGKGIKIIEKDHSKDVHKTSITDSQDVANELLKLDLQAAIVEAYEIDVKLGNSLYETYELLDQEMPPNLHIYSCDASEVLSKPITKETLRNPKYKVIILLKKCLSRICEIQLDSRDQLNLVKVELVDQIRKLMED
ncbi:hypothetical protein [Companilactobacillus sp. HBUAS56275]|uniref:Uncharacterized protein n=1 Tax=Candidatus Companilactobacillus pullicola TaxID=2838523 RepID=A0A9D1ZKY5_9LACO|nr:hypothetical protein [Candidatus Companilactobacillus pullicola]